MNNNITELKQKALLGMFWRFGERITAQVISFAVSIILARILLPEEYGIIAIVNIFIALANVLVTSGLGASLIQKKDADELDFSTTFYAGIVLAFMMYLGLYYISPYIADIYSNNDLILVLRVMGLRLPIAAINSVQQAYVARKMIFKKFFFSTLIGTIVSAVVGIIMAIKGFGVWALVAQYLTNTCIDTLVLFVTINWRPTLQFSFIRFKNLFSFGWKVIATGLLGEFFNQLKGMLIGARYTSIDLAYYNRGESIPTLITNNISSTIESVMFPTIAQIQDDKLLVKQAVRRMMKVSSFILMPILFGLAAVAQPLVKILLTDKWLFCIPYLQIVCIQQCFSILNTVNLQAFKAVGRGDVLLRLELIKKPIYLICIISSLPFGPLAIAIANLLYGIIALGVNSYPSKEILNYSTKEQIQDIIPYLLLAVSMGIVVLGISSFNFNIYILFLIQTLTGLVWYVIGARLFLFSDLKYLLSHLKIKKI